MAATERQQGVAPGDPMRHLDTPADEARRIREDMERRERMYGPIREERQRQIARDSEVIRRAREHSETLDMVPETPVLPLTADERREMEEEGLLDDPEDDPNIWEGFKTALSLDNTLAHIGRRSDGKVDPDFHWADHQEELTEMLDGIPERHEDYILDATSLQDARERREILKKDMEKEQTLADMGWQGFGLRMGASLLDPVAFAAGAGVGAPVAAAARAGTAGVRAKRAMSQTAQSRQMQNILSGTSRRVSRLPRTAEAMAVGGASGAAAEATLVNYKPTGTMEDVLFAAAGSAALAGAFTGAFSRSASTQSNQKLQAAYRELAKHYEDERALKALRDGTARIEAAPDANYAPVPSRAQQQQWAGQATPEEATRLFTEAPDDYSVFNRLRVDLSAQLDKSPNPMVRAFGRAAVQDATGRRGPGGEHVENPQTASEWQVRTQQGIEARLFRDYEAQFKEFRKREGISFINVIRARKDFNQRITQAVRSDRAYSGESPEVQRAADRVREHMEEMLELARNPGRYEGRNIRGPDGFEDVPRNPNYMPRIPDYAQIRRWRDSIGDEGLRQVIAGGIRAAHPDWSDEIVNRAAEGLRKGYLQPNFFRDINKVQGLSGENFDELRSILRNEANLEDDHIEGIIRAIRPDEDEAATHPRAMERTLLSEDTPTRVRDADGNEHDVSVMDFMQQDAMSLIQMYDRQITGLAAMARMGFRNDREWQDWLRQVDERAIEENISAGQMHTDQRNLDYAFRGIRGLPTENIESPWTHWMRAIRSYQFLRVMGQVGMAQLSEIGNVLGQEGLTHAVRHMPTMRSFMRDARNGTLRLRDGVLDEFEQAVGLGDDILKDYPMMRLEEHMVPADPAIHSEGLRRLETGMEYGRFAQSFVSGLHPINVALQRWSGRVVAGQFDKYAQRWARGEKIPEAIRNRMKWAGLNDQDMENIFRNIRDQSTREQGMFTDNVARFNLENWDPDVADKFRGAVHRITTRMIQENDVGNLHPWMGSTVGKFMMQFRTFMMNSWAKQFLHNVNMRDVRAFQTMMTSMVSAGTAYALQQHIRAYGRDNEHEFRREMLSEEAIAKAAFERSAWASIFPAAVDTAATAPGDTDPVFGFRASGLDTAITGSPMLDFAGSAIDALGGPLHTATRSEYSFSQEDASAWTRLLPFQNVVGIENALNALEAGFPRRSTIEPTQ